MRHHLVARQHPLDQQLDLAAGGLLAKQAGLDDLCVVEDEQIASVQQGWQVAEDAVCRRLAGAVQQAGGGALGGGVLGHQLGGQGEVEIADGEGAHGLEGRTNPYQVE